MAMTDVIRDIKEMNIGKVDENCLMSKYTTYKVGGKVKAIVYPKNLKCLIILIDYLNKNNVLYKVIGNGSNLLFSDDDYDGIIVKLNQFDKLTWINDNKLRVGAGYSLIKLSLLTAKKGLTGLECAAGIPGTVGGAVFMNAGAYKSDMGYVVEKVKVLTPDEGVITLSNKEMDFHYRSSYLQRHRDYIVLEVVIRLIKGKRELIEDVIRDRKRRRVESQPLDYPSAGSVFRNPEGMFAGQLIEELGLKGKTYGGAMISDKHANFIVNNTKNCKASDIKYLIDLAHDEVLKKYNVDMRIEQEFVNFK